ncbi:MAG: type I secretion protein TolC [Gammaproteobacteria bacterium]|nr:type I secretion protein TolC [Gammaproteobacteria bacterium]
MVAVTQIPARRRLLTAVLLLTAGGIAPAADLVDLLKRAELSEPQYREAQENALAVAEDIPQARALLWKPELAFTVGGSTNSLDITTEQDPAGRSASYEGSDYRITLRQPVYHHDRYVRLQQADKRLHQAQLEVDAAWQGLMVRLAERYFAVLGAQDDLSFARAERESLGGQLEQAKQRFEVGLIAITDVQEAQAGYDRAVAQVITAENAVQNAEEGLREVTGDYPASLWTLGDRLPLERPSPNDVTRWTETAINQNLDVAAALVATDIAQDDIDIASAGHYPTIDIDGSHGYNNAGGQFGDVQTTHSDIGIRLNVPIYSGGTVVSQTRQASHNHAAALERLERSRRATYRRARESFLGVVTQISAVQALGQSVISSAAALESTLAGFDVGTRTSVDVVTAERGLSQARRDLARARYDYILNLLRLKQAAGTLAPTDIALTNSWLKPGVIAATPTAPALR